MRIEDVLEAPEAEGLEYCRGGFVQVDERCATSILNVWAVGDLTGEPMLVHQEMAQGVVVAEVIAGYSVAR